MSVERRRPKGVWRRVERWSVGIVMAVIAFVLEKAVLRSVRKGRGSEAPSEEESPTTLRSKGGAVDL
jgi:hypothetical protein